MVVGFTITYASDKVYQLLAQSLMFNLLVFNDKYKYRNRYHKLSNVLNIYVTFKNLQSKSSVCDLRCKHLLLHQTQSHTTKKKSLYCLMLVNYFCF